MLVNELETVILNKISGNQKKSPSGWISLNCPMCVSQGESRPDIKKRGGFHIAGDSIIFHCFNCGFKTGWEPGKILGYKFIQLLKGLQVDEFYLNKLRLASHNEDNLSTEINLPKIKKIKLDWKTISLPEKSQIIGENTPEIILKYLESRGEGIYLNWDYYWSTDTYMDFNKRIIIPCYYKKKTVGWVARHIEAKEKKYFVNLPKNYMFNLDQILYKKRKYVILVEGIFDAIGIDAVGFLGNINKLQVDFLNESDRQIVLVPDYDQTGDRFINEALKHGWAVSFPAWDRDIKDVADAVKRYGRIFTLKNIIDNIETNPTKIKIKRKIN